MANPERRIDAPTFLVERFPLGIKLEVGSHIRVPQADLVQTMMNAGACVAFGLEPSLKTEGGVDGIYKKTPISLDNWGEGELGIVNSMWEAMDYMNKRQVEATEEVLDYYELFLMQYFGRPIKIDGASYPPEALLANPVLQSRQVALDKTMEALSYTGGSRLALRVEEWLKKIGEGPRRYLRGLSDEEIVKLYVPYPTELNEASTTDRKLPNT